MGKASDSFEMLAMVFRRRFEKWFRIKKVASHVTAFAEFDHEEAVLSFLVEGEREALLVDSGTGEADLRKAVSTITGKPVTVVNTHSHWDHVGGNELFRRKGKLIHGTKIALPPYTFEVYRTPGHSKDSAVLFERGKGWLFAGDTVYLGPIFLINADSSVSEFRKSLRFLKTLPIRRIFPGHNTFTCSPSLIDLLLARLATKLPPSPAMVPVKGRLRIRI